MGIQLANLCDAELDAFLEEFMQQEITSSCEMEATITAVGAGRPGKTAMARASAHLDRIRADRSGVHRDRRGVGCTG